MPGCGRRVYETGYCDLDAAVSCRIDGECASAGSGSRCVKATPIPLEWMYESVINHVHATRACTISRGGQPPRALRRKQLRLCRGRLGFRPPDRLSARPLGGPRPVGRPVGRRSRLGIGPHDARLQQHRLDGRPREALEHDAKLEPLRGIRKWTSARAHPVGHGPAIGAGLGRPSASTSIRTP